MRERVIRAARYVGYPLFYLFCLLMFGYLAFPYDQVKDRIIAEVERRGKPGTHLEIGHLSSYWFTGVEFSSVKLTLPPDTSSGSMSALPRSGEDFAAAASATAPKEATIAIDEGHARLRILPLLIGRARVDFWASALGGELEGTAPVGKGSGDVALTLQRIDIGKVEPLAQTLGVPLKGLASGKLSLTPVEGKFSKSSGTLDLTVEGLVVGDGKTKIQGLIELPPIRAGNLTLSAEAKDGALKVNKLTSPGTDLELIGDGKLAVREPWNDSSADLYIKFKVTDAYRGKSEITKTLFGDPNSTVPGLIEMQVPKMKRAKRSDGFYGWHVSGPLRRVRFDPSTADGPSASGSSAPTSRGRSIAPTWRRNSDLPGTETTPPPVLEGASPTPPPNEAPSQ